jgi:hypothetical protein
MATMAITREELLILLEEVSLANAAPLKLKSSARYQGGHEEFCRELASRVVDGLAEGGYCWARVPTRGDGLYRVFVEAIDGASGEYRFGLTSEDPKIRIDARWQIAERMLEVLRRTNTAVVRRKRS